MRLLVLLCCLLFNSSFCFGNDSEEESLEVISEREFTTTIVRDLNYSQRNENKYSAAEMKNFLYQRILPLSKQIESELESLAKSYEMIGIEKPKFELNWTGSSTLKWLTYQLTIVQLSDNFSLGHLPSTIHKKLTSKILNDIDFVFSTGAEAGEQAFTDELEFIISQVKDAVEKVRFRRLMTDHVATLLASKSDTAERRTLKDLEKFFDFYDAYYHYSKGPLSKYLTILLAISNIGKKELSSKEVSLQINLLRWLYNLKLPQKIDDILTQIESFSVTPEGTFTKFSINLLDQSEGAKIIIKGIDLKDMFSQETEAFLKKQTVNLYHKSSIKFLPLLSDQQSERELASFRIKRKWSRIDYRVSKEAHKELITYFKNFDQRLGSWSKDSISKYIRPYRLIFDGFEANIHFGKNWRTLIDDLYFFPCFNKFVKRKSEQDTSRIRYEKAVKEGRKDIQQTISVKGTTVGYGNWFGFFIGKSLMGLQPNPLINLWY